MKKIYSITLLMLIILSINVEAQNFDVYGFGSSTDMGNGGDAIVCRDENNKVLTVDILDYYESQLAPRDFEIDLGDKKLLVNEKIQLVISRIKKFSPDRANMYKKWSDEFFENSVFLPNIQLNDIPDSHHIAIPNNCKIEQIAIQIDPLFPEDKRYTVNKDLWDHLDNDNKAGLILHEIIYREAVDFKHNNSIATRYFNSLLASRRFQRFTQKQFVDVLELIQFDFIRIQGAKLHISPKPLFFSNDKLKSGRVVKNSEYYLSNRKVNISNNIEFYSSGVLKKVNFNGLQEVSVKYGKIINQLKVNNELLFYPSGILKRAKIMDKSMHFNFDNFELDIKCAQIPISYDKSFLEFWPNGMFHIAYLDRDTVSGGCKIQKNVMLFVNDKVVEVSKGSQLELWKNGALKHGKLTKGYSLVVGHGDKITIPPGSNISFYAGGMIREFWVQANYKFRLKFNFGVFEVSDQQRLYFYENGMLKSFFPSEAFRSYIVKIQNKNVIVHQDLYLYPNGNLKSIYLKRKTKLRTNHGREKFFTGGSTIYFDESGFVIEK